MEDIAEALNALERLSTIVRETKSSPDAEEIPSPDDSALKDITLVRQKLTNGLESNVGVSVGVGGGDETSRLRRLVAKLREDNATLTRELDLARSKLKAMAYEDKSEEQWKVVLAQMENEVTRQRESLALVKADRKRLKAEKSDLMGQMKRLYTTLGHRDAELKDLVAEYEMRVKEMEGRVRQARVETEALEREKWDMLKRARDSAERSLALRHQLDARDARIRDLEAELVRLRNLETPLTGSPNPSQSAGSGSGPLALAPPEDDDDDETLPPYTSEPTSSSISRSTVDEAAMRSTVFATQATYRQVSSSERDTPSPLPGDGGVASAVAAVAAAAADKPKKKKKTFGGSISRVFGRVKTKRSMESLDGFDVSAYVRRATSPIPVPTTAAVASLTQEQLQERYRVLEEARGTPMNRWKAATVVAWLEATMHMPQYADMCRENVKSGKLLIGLTDQEMQSGLGMTNIMHRKKLKLAIAECLHPNHIKYPKAGELDHDWISNVWIHDLGLSSHANAFYDNLVDGRVLSTLDKKELEKHLGIGRKYHQASIMFGIRLLKLLQFDKQALLERRAMCEEADTDPIVWTNQRLVQWIESIDLKEYAPNLRNSGVHGAAIVFEPSFGAEAMATAVGIPPSKLMVRRHLAEELDNLIRPARESLAKVLADQTALAKNAKKKSTGSVGRSLGRIDDDLFIPKKKKGGFKGSLGRAFGRRERDAMGIGDFFTDGSGEYEATVV